MIFELQNPAATLDLGARIARRLGPGDVVALEGPLGAGKTTLARGLICARVGAEIEVPSPTYTLVQTYETPAGLLWHCDLYRLQSPGEAVHLGLEDAFEAGVVLIEWPDRLGDRLPTDRLVVALAPSETSEGRRATITGLGAWRERLADV